MYLHRGLSVAIAPTVREDAERKLRDLDSEYKVRVRAYPELQAEWDAFRQPLVDRVRECDAFLGRA